MLTAIGNFFMNFLWGKLVKELIPAFFAWVARLIKKENIKKEVDAEESEVSKVKKEIKEWLDKNPNAKRIPKDLENKLRKATRKRNRGLSDGL